MAKKKQPVDDYFDAPIKKPSPSPEPVKATTKAKQAASAPPPKIEAPKAPEKPKPAAKPPIEDVRVLGRVTPPEKPKEEVYGPRPAANATVAKFREMERPGVEKWIDAMVHLAGNNLSTLDRGNLTVIGITMSAWERDTLLAILQRHFARPPKAK